MWIATNRGFLSVVTADPRRLPKAEAKLVQPLCVRARNADHLRTLFPGFEVYQFKHRDYPARIFIAAADLSARMAQAILDIDYSNFKDSVKDDPLHDAYMGVWSVMNRYGRGGFDRKPRYDARQASFYDRYTFTETVDERPFNEQVTDDDLDDDLPCSTPGCTDLNPCLNCIMSAMENDPRSDEELIDLADQKHEAQVGDMTDYMMDIDEGKERYGDFDSGDERDDDDTAESHRRHL